MRSKLFETENQRDAVIEVLESHGYKASTSIVSPSGININDRPSSRYATLQDSSKGFYISTTGTWIKEIDDVELYAGELKAAGNVLADINKILQG